MTEASAPPEHPVLGDGVAAAPVIVTERSRAARGLHRGFADGTSVASHPPPRTGAVDRRGLIPYSAAARLDDFAEDVVERRGSATNSG